MFKDTQLRVFQARTHDSKLNISSGHSSQSFGQHCDNIIQFWSIRNKCQRYILVTAYSSNNIKLPGLTAKQTTKTYDYY